MSLMDKEFEMKQLKAEQKSKKYYILVGITCLSLMAMLYVSVLGSRAKGEKEQMAESLDSYKTANETMILNNEILKSKIDELNNEITDKNDTIDFKEKKFQELKLDNEALAEKLYVYKQIDDDSPISQYLWSQSLSKKVIENALQLYLLEKEVSFEGSDYSNDMLRDIQVVDETHCTCLFEFNNEEGDKVYRSVLYSYTSIAGHLEFEKILEEDSEFQLASQQEVPNQYAFVMGTLKMDQETFEIKDIFQFTGLWQGPFSNESIQRYVSFDGHSTFVYDMDTNEKIKIEDNIVYSFPEMTNTDRTKTIVNNGDIFDLYTFERIPLESKPEYSYGRKSFDDYILQLVDETESVKTTLLVHNWKGELLYEQSATREDEYAEGNFVEIIGYYKDNVYVLIGEWDYSGQVLLRAVNIKDGSIRDIGRGNYFQLTMQEDKPYFIATEFRTINNEKIGHCILDYEGHPVEEIAIDLLNYKILNYNPMAHEILLSSYIAYDMIELGEQDDMSLSYSIYHIDTHEMEEIEIPLWELGLPKGDYVVNRISDGEIYLTAFFMENNIFISDEGIEY